MQDFYLSAHDLNFTDLLASVWDFRRRSSPARGRLRPTSLLWRTEGETGKGDNRWRNRTLFPWQVKIISNNNNNTLYLYSAIKGDSKALYMLETDSNIYIYIYKK